MLKLRAFLITLTVLGMAKAQNEQDALRYSTVGIGNTARTLGMAGAFSSIGADPGAAMINPAAIAVFRRSEFGIGLNIQNNATRGTYYSTLEKGSKINFSLPNINMVIAVPKYDDKGKPARTGITATNVGLHINRLASFHNNTRFSGVNTQGSITDYFAADASSENAAPNDLYFGKIGKMAYDAFAIDYNIASVNNQYLSGYKDSNRNSLQSGDISQNGNIYEYQISGGLAYNNRIFIGAALFYTSLTYKEALTFSEDDLRKNAAPDIKTVNYIYNFSDRGGAAGARIGFIAKPTEQMRISAAVTTPRIYKINSAWNYEIETQRDPGQLGALNGKSIMEEDNTYSYTSQTPTRINLGFGFVIDRTFIINADIEFLNYTTMKLNSDGDAYIDVNKNIRNLYRNTTNVRIGGELNLKQSNEKAVRLRAGFALYGSPYNQSKTGSDEILNKPVVLLACGLGVREKNNYIDVGLGIQTNRGYYTPYVLNDNLFKSSSIEYVSRRVSLNVTMGFNIDGTTE